MSEKLMRFFLLSDIKTVRLVCKRDGCGGIVEVPLRKLELVKFKSCMVCGLPYFDDPTSEACLHTFFQSVAMLQAEWKHLEIEFVQPAEKVCKLDRPVG